MQVIIPLAGKGTRLRPHTHLIPKPMLKVAGRPVMDWVMDRLKGLHVDELIFITGHLKGQVEQYCRANYKTPSRFIEQKVQDGTAGAINLARPFVHGPVMIIFVDTVFEADLSLAEKTDADGIIWAKEVEDYQRFGVVVTDRNGYMTKIIEKPSEPISKLANIGLYYIKDVDALWRGIDHVLTTPANKGEWYLTDASWSGPASRWRHSGWRSSGVRRAGMPGPPPTWPMPWRRPTSSAAPRCPPHPWYTAAGCGPAATST